MSVSSVHSVGAAFLYPAASSRVERALECMRSAPPFSAMPVAGNHWELAPLQKDSSQDRLQELQARMRLRFDSKGRLERPFCPPREHALDEGDIRFFMEMQIRSAGDFEFPISDEAEDLIFACASLESLMLQKSDSRITELVEEYRLLGMERAICYLRVREKVVRDCYADVFDQRDWYEACRYFKDPDFICKASSLAKSFIDCLNEAMREHSSVVHQINLHFLEDELKKAAP